MLTAQHMIILAEMRQREVYVAVKIAALILKTGGSISEKSAKTIFKYNDLVWAEIKDSLKQFFKFANGRIDFYSAEDRPDPWDLTTPEEIAKMDKEFEKLRARQNIPLTSVQQDIYNLGGFDKPGAKSFYFSMSRTFGALAVETAVAAATNAKPGDPKAYLISCLRKAAQSASGGAASTAGRQMYPTRIRKFERPVNPEATPQSLLGWEHPLKYDADGSPVWKDGVRSMIFRLRTGELKFETPPLGAVVPTLEQNPGCIIS